MGRKVGDMKSVRVTVPQNKIIVQGNFYLLDGFLGMAVQSVTTGEDETAEIILSIEPGEYETGQINDEDAFAKGAKVYYDNTNKQFTTTALNNRFAGIVTNAKDANGIICFNFMPTSSEVASALGTSKSFVTFSIPGELVAGAHKVADFVFNKVVTVTKIKARVKTLPGADAAMSFDVNNGANSLFTAAPSIASTDTALSFKEYTPDADPARNVFTADGILSIDIDNAGVTAAADLEIVVEYDQPI